MDVDFDFDHLLADAARELATEPATVTTVERAVELCRETLSACALAGISVVENGRIVTLAATDEILQSIDRHQLELGEGPSCEPWRNHEVLSSPDLSHDPRWPVWGPRVVAGAGLCSVLALPLFATPDARGMLTLYARTADAFDDGDQLEAQVLAAHASVALATGLKERQLHRALASRTVIGQATGILIERFGLTPDQAFSAMRRVSQNHNIKIHALAEHLVRTGVLLPQDGEPPDGEDLDGKLRDGEALDGKPQDPDEPELPTTGAAV